MRRIILASGSPRRRELLQQMGVEFEVIPSDFDEYLDHTMSARAMTIELGLGKARAVAEKHPEALVIGSDTIVSLGRQHLGKAKDEDEARQMILSQTGQTVEVTSSVVVVCKELGLEEAMADTAKVVLKPASTDLIEAYLKTNDWTDKAGAWGIQSGAAPLMDYMEGEYDTILGLPTKLLSAMLQKQGIAARPVILTSPVRVKSARKQA